MELRNIAFAIAVVMGVLLGLFAIVHLFPLPGLWPSTEAAKTEPRSPVDLRSQGKIVTLFDAVVSRYGRFVAKRHRVIGAHEAEGIRNSIHWIQIPGGDFMMGSMSGDSDEMPVHHATVKSFQMAKTEVTDRQYRACVAAGACTPLGPESSCKNVSSADNQPVVCVDWNQANAFSRWVGGRLPTEAEWEYASRSAGKSWEYPWGNEAPSCDLTVMNMDGGGGCSIGLTWPVCSKTIGNTRQGLCDMAGNASEWTQDSYHDSYNGAPTDGSAWESPAASEQVISDLDYKCLQLRLQAVRESEYVHLGTPTTDEGACESFERVNRVIRGGDSGCGSFGLRTSKRFKGNPYHRDNDVGFRPVRESR